jgi:hypothetical protein
VGESVSGWSEAELRRCRDSLGVVSLARKVCALRNLRLLRDLYVEGDPFRYVVAYDPRQGHYVALKVDAIRHVVVSETSL